MAVGQPGKPEPAALLRFMLREHLPDRAPIAAKPHPEEAKEAVDVHLISGRAKGWPGFLTDVDNLLLLVPDLRRATRCRLE
eukprot:13178521-Alexandrium_andersonii.AAC.1